MKGKIVVALCEYSIHGRPCRLLFLLHGILSININTTSLATCRTRYIPEPRAHVTMGTHLPVGCAFPLNMMALKSTGRHGYFLNSTRDIGLSDMSGMGGGG